MNNYEISDGEFISSDPSLPPWVDLELIWIENENTQ